MPRREITIDEFIAIIEENRSDHDKMYDLGVKGNTLFTLDIEHQEFMKDMRKSERYRDVESDFKHNKVTGAPIIVLDYLPSDAIEMLPEDKHHIYKTCITFCSAGSNMKSPNHRELNIHAIADEMTWFMNYIKEKKIPSALLIMPDCDVDISSPIYYNPS